MQHGRGIIFQQDNDSKHNAKATESSKTIMLMREILQVSMCVRKCDRENGKPEKVLGKTAVSKGENTAEIYSLTLQL